MSKIQQIENRENKEGDSESQIDKIDIIQFPINFNSCSKEQIKKIANYLHKFSEQRHDNLKYNTIIYRKRKEDMRSWIKNNNIRRLENISDTSVKEYMKSRYKIIQQIDELHENLFDKCEIMHQNENDDFQTWMIEKSLLNTKYFSRKNIEEQIVKKTEDIYGSNKI